MSVKKAIFWRAMLAFGFVALIAMLILGKMLHIQTRDGQKWRAMADSLTTKFEDVAPNRGNIYSANGRLMATSLYTYDVHMDLHTDFLEELYKSNGLHKQLDTLSEQLSTLFRGVREKTKATWYQELKMAYAANKRYFPIRNGVNNIQLQELRTFNLYKMGQFKGGLIVQQRTERKRPYQMLAKRTVGYVKDKKLVGLEGGFNNYLAGVKGYRLLQKVGNKDWIPIHDKNEIEPENGVDIYTTIDIFIQDFVEQSLEKQIVKTQADHGTAVVMEVATGKIKAIANLTLNPATNRCFEGWNYAVGESTHPGSTFKIAGLLALLDQNLMTLDDTIPTGNGIKEFYNLTMRDSKHGGHGTISLKRIIEVSSNIGIALALENNYKNREDKFSSFLSKMKLDLPIKVPMLGEPNPTIKTKKGSDSWSGTTLAWMAHGYELTLTPLQTLMIFSAVANKGRMMQPYFVTKIGDRTKILEEFDPQIRVANAFSEETALLATEVLRGVVENEGTAKNIYDPTMKLAAKTGTVVLRKPNEAKKYQASIAGFFPADQPKYACIVVINKPTTHGTSGAKVAGPVFKDIAQKLYSYDVKMLPAKYADNKQDIESRPTFIQASTQDLKTIYSELSHDVLKEKITAEWAEPNLFGNKIKIQEKITQPGKVPNLRGLSLSDAVYICENLGLKTQTAGSGNIYKQKPLPGTDLRAVNKIYLELQ